MSQSKPSKLLYCYLREKYTSLEVITGNESEGEEVGRQSHRCLDADDVCSERRCKLSDFGRDNPDDSREPWFDD